MTNKKLDKFIDVFFPSEDLEKVDINLIKKYKKVLPKELIKIWKDYGFGNYLFGFIKFINPDDFLVYIKVILGLDSSESIPFMIDSIGNIFYLNECKEVWVININSNIVDKCTDNFSDFLELMVEDFFIKHYLYKDIFDLEIIKENLLENDEIYVINPPSFMNAGNFKPLVLKKNIKKYYDFIIPFLTIVKKD